VNLVSEPMSVAAGRAWDQWITRLTRGLQELIAEGEAPAFAGLDRFIELNERLRLAVKSAADDAAKAGKPTFSVDVPYSAAERRMLADMGDTLLSYLEVLTLRGKIDAKMSPAVTEALAAISPMISARRHLT
jgi:hypothetical protein